MYTKTERDLFKQARQLGLATGTLKNIEFRLRQFKISGHLSWLDSIQTQITNTLREIS
jgi:hypothetical protein